MKSKYGLTEKDLIGEIEGFPIEVVEKMMEEQERQGNGVNVAVFQINSSASAMAGGFDWGRAEFKEWACVEGHKNFDLFFEHYPKEIEIPEEILACKIESCESIKDKRFQVACAALTGLCANPNFFPNTKGETSCAGYAWDIADELLKQENNQ